jgi:alpha-tubulin suppressor-like RCC1 family protein
LRVAFLCFCFLFSAGCEAPAALGAPCTRASECGAALVCRLGRCRSECALNRDCPIEARCLLDAEGNGSCSVPTDVCSASTCEGTLLCVEGACVSGCDPADAVCPADARCIPIPGTSGGICDATRAGADAGRDAEPADAGMPDATPDDAGCGASSCGEATAIAIGLGDHYTSSPCAVRRGGDVWCWGSNPLGDGDPTRPDCAGDAECSPTPVRVLELDSATEVTQPIEGATEIVAVDTATCAVVAGGGLRCWGLTGNSQIPVSMIGVSVAQRGIDAMLRPLAGITSISLGRYTGFALVGSSWLGWGQGTYGVLNEATPRGHLPEPLAMLDGMTRVSGGNDYACGLRGAAVSCWGINAHGELGHVPVGIDPATSEFYFDPMPAEIALPTSVVPVAVASGLDTACALDDGGHAWCWGSDGHGALGNFAPASAACGCEVTPVQVDLPLGVTLDTLVSAPMDALTCGLSHGDGLVYCWGRSDGGEAGLLHDVVAPEAPIAMEEGGALHAMAVAVGSGGGCAIDLAGDVWCWGRNENGRLGIGTTDVLPHPTATRVLFP